MLCVLRWLPGGEYTYVGDAYIHGVGGGEVFEGMKHLWEFVVA